MTFHGIISLWKSRSPSTFGFDFPSRAKSSRSIGIIVQSLPNPYYVCLVWIIITGSFYILHSPFPSPLSLLIFSFFSIWYTVRVCCQVSVHTSLINTPVQAHLVKEYIKPRVFLPPPPTSLLEHSKQFIQLSLQELAKQNQLPRPL